MTGQHVHVIPYKYPIFGQRTSDQEFQKKDTKAYSTYKSWIIFLRQTALNFPKAATKKCNDQQKQGNNRNKHPAVLSSSKRKYRCLLKNELLC